jgi:hypothetical protein
MHRMEHAIFAALEIVALSGDPAEEQWVSHYPNVAVLGLQSDRSPRSMPLDGWAQLVERTLATGQIAFLTGQTSRRRSHLDMDDLPSLGLQLLEELDTSTLCNQEHVELAAADVHLKKQQQAHAAHRQFDKIAQAIRTRATSIDSPSPRLEPSSPEVIESLERLDDLVYEAIGGRPETMDQLRVEWPKIIAELGDPTLMESLEQYLRYALSIWDECNEAEGVRNPTRAIQALDVLSLIFGNMK